ncbi:MAG: DUF3857 domain-containing protein [Oligoflexia bacterium]|nr:DUF3857 domain-containing protein [Oligoflexia bacterium]
MTIKKIFISIFYINALIFSSTVLARWGTVDDAFLEMKTDVTYNVRADGTYDVLYKISYKILKEAVITNFTPYRDTYSPESTVFQMIEAKTITSGGLLTVVNLSDPSEYSDTTVAGSSVGHYDQHHEIQIKLPNVLVGTTITIIWKETITKPNFPEVYANSFLFDCGLRSICEKKITINSEKNLFYDINNPDNVLNVREATPRSLIIETRQPLLDKFILSEPTEKISIDNRLIPSLTVSTIPANRWDILAIIERDGYEHVLAQPLPGAFDTIRAEVQSLGQIDLERKINEVVDRLSKVLNYLSDNRTIGGRLVPQALSLVAGQQIGDCKDYATVTTAILRSLGINASVALVWASSQYQAPPNTNLPRHRFNHAIVRVLSADQQRILWVDPTNKMGYAQGVFPTIADRDALVLDPQNPGLAQIPKIDAQRTGMTVIDTIVPVSEDMASHRLEISLTGAEAIPLTSSQNSVHKNQIAESILSYVINLGNVSNFSFVDFDLRSRIVEDLKFTFTFTEQREILEPTTTENYVYHCMSDKLEVDSLSLLKEDFSDRVGDFYINEHPSTKNFITVIKKSGHFDFSGNIGNRFDREVDSEWVKVTRSVVENENEIIKTNTIVYKTGMIPNADLHSERFIRLQQALRKNFRSLGFCCSCRESIPRASGLGGCCI